MEYTKEWKEAKENNNKHFKVKASIGNKFVLTSDLHIYFKQDEIVTLTIDDGSSSPLFVSKRNEDISFFCNWFMLKPIKKKPIMANNEKRIDDDCNGCIYKPELNSDNYPEECVMCSRWYSDGYVKNEMKILNLYAGIGGNRKLWGDSHEVTAVEYDKAIAEAYKSRYPDDTMIIGDAKEYLLKHYKEFDLIWASPPCQSHTRVRKATVDSKFGPAAIYPDMSLYQVILFLDNYFKGKYVVENVIPFYKELIKPSVIIDRHNYWSNFVINCIVIEKDYSIQNVIIEDAPINLNNFRIKNKIQVIRNQVNSEVGLYILDCALNQVKHKQGGLFND